MGVQFIIFLCLGLTLSAADITEEKASAIRKVEAQRKMFDELAHKLTFGGEQDKVNRQTMTRLNYGSVLSERAHFEIGQLAVGARLIADLMKAGKDVVECMEDRKAEAQKENQIFLMDGFYRPVRESQHKCEKTQMDDMFDWEYKKSDLYKEYNKLYDGALDEIKNACMSSEISSALNKILPKGEFFVECAREVVEKVYKLQRDQLAFGDEKVNALREFVRSQVDKTAESLQDCFVVNTAYYKIKTALSKSM